MDLWPIIRQPALHLALLRELTLVEPFILYDSLVCNRGRWGQRPILLKRALDRLRANSSEEEVLAVIRTAGPDGRQFDVLPAVSGYVAWTALVNRLWPPTITTGSKVAQRTRRMEMRGELIRLRVVDAMGYRPW